MGDAYPKPETMVGTNTPTAQVTVGIEVPYLLAYKSPLCGPCESNDPLLGGTYSKGIYYIRWSVRHTNFVATLC